MFCLRACVSLETRGLCNRSTFSILCASGWEGGREKRQDTQGGFSLYVTLRPCGRQMCVWVSWGGWHSESVCLHAHAVVHLHTRASVCVLVFLTSSSVSNLCVWWWEAGWSWGPRGTAVALCSPSLAAWAGLGFHWGSPRCLCVRHRLTIPMYI